MLNVNKTNFDENEIKYLKLLSNQFPNSIKASSEIINLQAILNLPKGTEHFLSDIHGEYESFIHVLKNASGVIRQKINEIFGFGLTEKEKKSLASLIYYPEQKIEIILKNETDISSWYMKTLYQLIEICRVVSSKYTRSKVRKSLPADFAYIIEELLHEHNNVSNKQEYYMGIIETIIDIDRAKDFIVAISQLIQRLIVDRLHIVGDIFDRGPGSDIIMEQLIKHHSVDIQWGNHDILWMGAACGSEACIANVVRLCLRYGNMKLLEEGYGINLVPLATFALEYCKEVENKHFHPKLLHHDKITHKEIDLITKMHKSITIIQFKLEAQTIKRRPIFDMDNRTILDKIDLTNGTVNLDGIEYKLNESSFSTINPNDPFALTPDETSVVEKLKSSFISSDKLQKHISFLYAKGGLYLTYNSNLLYHGCIPMNKDGTFKKITIDNNTYFGKSFMDRLERLAREAYFGNGDAKEYGKDVMWYLWCGPNSPLFAKNKMTTFERYFIDDKESHKEEKNPYYNFRDNEETCKMILVEFGLDPEDSHIISGHVPVKVKNGESPIKANGKLMVIDGGFSKAYQPETGIAGYTLIYNSYGLQLVSHEPFESTKKAIEEEKDILTLRTVLEKASVRKTIADTDIGRELKRQILDLKKLLIAYRMGIIKEKNIL